MGGARGQLEACALCCARSELVSSLRRSRSIVGPMRDRVCSLLLTSGGKRDYYNHCFVKGKAEGCNPVRTFPSLPGGTVTYRAGKDVMRNTFYCILPFRSLFPGLPFLFLLLHFTPFWISCVTRPCGSKP